MLYLFTVLTFYLLLSLDVCCNPYKIHQSKPITKFLRKINSNDTKKVSFLIVGQFWCGTCRLADPKDYVNKLEPDNSEGIDGKYRLIIQLF